VTTSRALRYFFREAAEDLWRRRTTNIISIGSIGASLYVVGLFILGTTNLGRLVSSWARENQVSVYLADELPAEERESLARRISAEPAVEAVVHLSKEEALARFREEFPDLADLAMGLETNPLPESLEITLRKGAASPEVVEDLSSRLGAERGVEGVRADLAWVRRVRSLLELLGLGGMILGGILVGAAGVTIAGVIRLNVLARREEIEILRLVGATRGFIRGPFLVEGAFQGIAAALLALGCLAATWALVSASGAVRSDMLLQALAGRFLPLWAPPALLGTGFAVGLLGALLSVRSAIVSHRARSAS
jgi:cell division transport system permease protein